MSAWHKALQATASEAWGEGEDRAGRKPEGLLRQLEAAVHRYAGWISESEGAHLAVLGGQARLTRIVKKVRFHVVHGQADWDASQLCKTDGGGVVAALFEALALILRGNSGVGRAFMRGADGPDLLAARLRGPGRSCGTAEGGGKNNAGLLCVSVSCNLAGGEAGGEVGDLCAGPGHS